MDNRPIVSPTGWLRGRLGHPVGWGWALSVSALVLIAPLWLWADPLDGFSPGFEGLGELLGRLGPLADPFGGARLQLDDFEYVAEARTASDLPRHLLRPHNTHLVPLFRLWTYVWAGLAGTLERLPWVLGLASYLTYLAAMLLVGHLVAWESGRPSLGLGVMAAFGVSAVLEPTVRWFAASQALAAGVAILSSLAAWQRWRSRGGRRWLAAGSLAVLAAPLIWSGGYVAGPAGAAYLWSDGRPRARKVALLPLALTALVALGALMIAGRTITAAENFHDRPLSQAIHPIQGAVSTVQGIVEVLALRNLGLDAPTTPAQALMLLALLVVAWAWLRGWMSGHLWRPNPLERAGGVMAILGFWLVYSARGYFTFDSLRDLSWYHAIPQLGAALFAAGVCVGRSRAGEPPPRSLARPSLGGLLAVLGIVLVALVLQTPRVRARLVATAPPLSAWERSRFPEPRLQSLRARYLDGAWVAWQRRFLARLDRAEATARRLGASRQVLRTSLGRVIGPGMPANVQRIDGVNLLALPESGSSINPAPLRTVLLPILAPEPEPRPKWLPPGEPWPPRP